MRKASELGDYLEIHEVFLDRDGVIHSYTADSIKPCGEDEDELLWELKHMMDDIIEYGVIDQGDLPLDA